MFNRYSGIIKSEFHKYNPKRFSKDIMAGITVAAVALPLALAFGVSSGADAASGLITAIIAGIIIGIFSGASYQISGPTGAMVAILIPIVAKYTLQGVFIVSILAGIILLLAGVLKLGKLVSIIPRPVITGFTSGIAVIIALGQIDHFFGTTSAGEGALQKLLSYGELGFLIQWQPVVIGAIVVGIMIFWPKNLGKIVPSSLVGIVVATLVSSLFNFQVSTIGAIPRTLLPDVRFDLTTFQLSDLPIFISPAISIAALSMVESLLCGTSALRMKKNGSFDADQELVAQGIGNIIIPFFGGIPATAAIARTSVAIKSGSETRLTSVIHAVMLLASMFLLSDVMANIPNAALAGVLMVTAWRMNEWCAIKKMFSKRNRGAVLKFLITLAATVMFDLTIAIIIGVAFSAFIFVVNSSKLNVASSKVKNDLFHACPGDVEQEHVSTTVIYITGPLFFGNAEKLFEHVYGELEDSKRLIFSMRGVSGIDSTGAEVILDIVRECDSKHVSVTICGLSDMVRKRLDTAGVTDIIGKDAYFFSVDRALLASQSKHIPC